MFQQYYNILTMIFLFVIDSFNDLEFPKEFTNNDKANPKGFFRNSDLGKSFTTFGGLCKNRLEENWSTEGYNPCPSDLTSQFEEGDCDIHWTLCN